ncbi:MAG: tetratricopeptide repeat protein [Verrucomicrobiota bacterium]|nr:tetratricopeptide repeat protein [Verrucomicrobiota bacterium]
MNSLTSDERALARWLAICAACTAITLAVFAQTFSFDFLNFDDDLFISANPKLAQGLTIPGLQWAFGANLTHHDSHAEYWEPLTLLTRLADAQFSGLNAGAHHRTSVLLHLAAGLILFGAMRALLRSDATAAVIAALFLVHPLHVEAVAWLSARKDVLNGLFFCATLWVYAWYAARPNWKRFAALCLAFLCANMAKPMAVSLPVVLLLLDIWPLRRFPERLVSRATLRLILEKVPLLLMAGAVAFLAVIDQQQQGAMGDDVLYPLPVRLGNAAVSYCAYLGQTFLPVKLAILYPHPGTALHWAAAAASAIFLLVITVGCVLQLKRRPWLFVGWMWFVVVLLPVSGIVQIGEMSRADRYTYISLVGIFLLCAQQAREWLTRRAQQPALRAVAAAVIVAVVLAFAAVAWVQTSTWRNGITVFRHALSVTQSNYIAEANLGNALFAAGDRQAGVEHYNEALRLNAPALDFHRRSGLEAERQGQWRRAIQHYSKVLTLAPADVAVHQRLGGVLLQTGDYAKALVQFNECLRYERSAIPPRVGVARALIGLRRPDEARGLLNFILQMDPGSTEAAELLHSLPEPQQPY